MRPALILTALVAASALSLSAQSTQPRPIKVGQSVNGRLGQSDGKFSDGSFFQLYTFSGKQGDVFAVNLSSDDFDANLLIADAAGKSLTQNDDGGGQCNARLTFVAPATGSYRLYANSSARAELGEYKLSLASGRAAAVADTVCKGFGRVAGMIEVGEAVAGHLTPEDPQFSGDSTFYQRWILPVRANQVLTIDLESSEFDAYMLLTRGRGDKLVESDDGGAACNARIIYTSHDDHPLRIIVNTAARPKGQAGRFTLRVTEGKGMRESSGGSGNCRLATATTAPVIRQASNVSRAAATVPSVRVGETVNGALTNSDSLYPDNSYYKFYEFTAPAGQPVTIDLASDDFDPVLIVRGEDLAKSIINDDGGPGCSSRVARVFPSRGPYRILVNSTATPERQTGSFTLSITQGSKPVQEAGNADCRRAGGAEASTSTAENAIAIGQTRQGTLTRSDVLLRSDSTYAQAWTIQGRAGQTITVDLESDDFDAYMFLRGPGIAGAGRDRSFQDDDGGGNCNARLTVTFPEDGAYEIDVNTAEHYATGSFTLSVTSGSKPKSVARCRRSTQ